MMLTDTLVLNIISLRTELACLLSIYAFVHCFIVHNQSISFFSCFLCYRLKRERQRKIVRLLTPAMPPAELTQVVIS